MPPGIFLRTIKGHDRLTSGQKIAWVVLHKWTVDCLLCVLCGSQFPLPLVSLFTNQNIVHQLEVQALKKRRMFDLLTCTYSRSTVSVLSLLDLPFLRRSVQPLCSRCAVAVRSPGTSSTSVRLVKVTDCSATVNTNTED